ncbi:MAG: hypothetical protein IPJ30_14595 [Acidobacteria bacterium]|nr:hypothetical protein [Acidobacteriota bacterium]
MTIGNIELRIRIIYAPMTRSRASDDGVQPDYVAGLSPSSGLPAGLLIHGSRERFSNGEGIRADARIYTAEQIDSWRRVADAVHAAGGRDLYADLSRPAGSHCPICFQETLSLSR